MPSVLNYIQMFTEETFGKEFGELRKMVCYESLSVEQLGI
jgi:hypothetical protein